MRLSIGIPAYNQGSFLRETLESVLRQDVPFHEIVVSNNHSTDTTAEVIAAVQAEYPGRIRVVTPPEHLTMARNWNFLVGELTGDWFSLLSSDDLALPTFAKSVEAAVALSSDAVLVRGAWRVIDLEGRSQGDHHLLSVAKVTKPPKTLYEQRFGPKGSFAAFALKRETWEKAGRFPERVTLVGDWGMWLMAGALGDIVYTDDVIAAYRTGHQVAVIRGRHHIHMRESLTVYQEILPLATQLGGFGVPEWIAKASRERFRETIIATSQEYTAEERQPKLVDAFRPWAEATGEQALFARFEGGEVLTEFRPVKALKPMLRKVVAALKGSH
jgi:glycosyltransferase involved in cell wall biosynthesis